MKSDSIRVGIVGAGANTRERHIPGLRAIAGVEIISLCNRTLDSSKRAADKLGIRTVYPTWRELIQAPDTDAIVIGTWPNMHCRVTLAALEAGKHVMCEARMAMDLGEAVLMRDAARARPQLVAQIVPSPVAIGVDQTIRRLIAEGHLGDLLAIEVRAAAGFLDLTGTMHWRQDSDLSGVNTLSLGIWYEAIMRWVGEATRVTAMGKTFVRMRPDDSGTMRAVTIPEHINVIADLACGAQLHMMISAAAGLAGPPEACLFGTQGTLRIQGNELYLGRRGDDRLSKLPVPASEQGAWRVEEEFIAAIRGEETIKLTSFEDGVKYMRFTQAAVRSMAQERTIPLTP